MRLHGGNLALEKAAVVEGGCTGLWHCNQLKAAHVPQSTFTKALHGMFLKIWVQFHLSPSKNEVQGPFMCGTGF